MALLFGVLVVNGLLGHTVDFSENEELAVFCVHAATALFFFILPVILTIFIVRNQSNLTDPEFEAKYGRVYKGIKLQPLSAILYYAVFAVRRYNLILFNLFFSYGSPLSQVDRTDYLSKTILFTLV